MSACLSVCLLTCLSACIFQDAEKAKLIPIKSYIYLSIYLVIYLSNGYMLA